MINYSLQCEQTHGFEGWFASSADFDRQKAMGLVTCPYCDSKDVSKTLMAPNVTTGRQKDRTQAVVMDNMRREMIAKVKDAVKEIRANAEDVGQRFPEEARKIHYGESEARGIIGQATPDEAQALTEEGIEVAALPVFPEDQH
ncbi:DUF1178 family protein [Rhizobium sp.]